MACGLFIAVCGLLSSFGVLALECVGSVAVALGFSCPAACGILVPQPGIELISLALEGGFLTIGPPGKSPVFCCFWMGCSIYIMSVWFIVLRPVFSY